MAKSNTELESEIRELEKRVIALEKNFWQGEDERFPPAHLGMDAKLRLTSNENFPRHRFSSVYLGNEPARGGHYVVGCKPGFVAVDPDEAFVPVAYDADLPEE